MDAFLLALDFIGTFVFAISGATIGVRHRLDLFGVLVVSFAAATSGGIVRDLLIGATPPAALDDWRYLGVSCLAGLITFYRYAAIERLRNPVQLFDAAGLGLFAVSGAMKALAFGLGPVMAMLLGMLSGIGGGIVCDILVARTPVVLQAELYAVAAMAGAAGGHRPMAGVAKRAGRRCWRRVVLRPALHGHSPWLASARRAAARFLTQANS